MSTYREYRVVSKRVGQARKVKTYRGRTQAQRRLLLFGPEPWTAYTDEDPDTYVCCKGSPQEQ